MNATPIGSSSGPRMVRVYHNHGNPINLHRVQLPCGHKFVANMLPRGGCTQCWKAFFQSAPTVTRALLSAFEANDQPLLAKIKAQQGAEFIKQAKSFYLELKAEAEARIAEMTQVELEQLQVTAELENVEREAEKQAAQLRQQGEAKYSHEAA